MRDNALLKNSCNNIERTWITSTVWPPKSWSMFNQHRWTKSNAEGYHNHLKLEVASNSPNLMKFNLKLKEEADKIYLKAKLLSQEQALQRESSDTANMQHHLTAAWEKYNDKKYVLKSFCKFKVKLILRLFIGESSQPVMFTGCKNNQKLNKAKSSRSYAVTHMW
ncbi:hypothetical protein DAPPUDRAFT_330160 [Daphnia pulex]|uniref:Uncharacterized protein n=1 Tax=Daphnia pulex TaxID=6669 RepID=E9HIQ2_DAPPU|nr:hypothetical protein DAPPUDRAFT_330160 [Daphnia pulex]|eukprot:EFX68393.1 hypothetical protein DAPPUDRAFT_330160 [Daphnia pulex]